MMERDQQALWGPQGRGEYQVGDTLSFIDSGLPYKGEVLFIRAPGVAVQGGVVHPTMYIVDDGIFPRAIYAKDIIANEP